MKVLQEKSIFGGEAKPLPYMLAQMNLLLHGLKSPQIAYGNSLAGKLTEIGNRDRVDVILTNPPFGGEEEAGHSQAISRPTSRLPKRPCCSCNSSCGSCGGDGRGQPPLARTRERGRG